MGTAVIKSELVQRIAKRNPQLFQRDVENIVNAILDEITNAHARGAIRAPARLSRSRKNPCRSSRPARKCANG
jgi:hypothetical protein